MRCSLISYYISEQLRKTAHYIVLVLRMCLCGVGTYVSISMKSVMQSQYELMTLPVCPRMPKFASRAFDQI